MKIKSFAVIPLAIFSLNICAVEERVHDFSVIENFAIAFKNDLLAHSVSKISNYTRCRNEKSTCTNDIHESIKAVCNDEPKFVLENGSICNLLAVNSLKIDVQILNDKNYLGDAYLITYYDSMKMKSPAVETQSNIVKSANKWNGLAEVIVFKDQDGLFKIDSYLFETSSIWIEKK
jgi:hypothetical protein